MADVRIDELEILWFAAPEAAAKVVLGKASIADAAVITPQAFAKQTLTHLRI